MTKEEFCYRLKELNLTQKDFANIAHIPYSTLNNWGTTAQNGKIIPVPSWQVCWYSRACQLQNAGAHEQLYGSEGNINVAALPPE